MNFMKHLEPKYSTLIQATILTFLLVLISHIFEKEEAAAEELRTVVALRQ